MRAIEDQVILVTGSTDGLGKGTAQALAAIGASVLLHGRDPSKLERTLRAMEKATGNDRIKAYLADFSSLDEVRHLAAKVQEDNNQLDVLINNAGIGYGRPNAQHRETSKDGYELRFQVNYLAHFMLTGLLVPLLRQSAPCRIVNVTSLGQEAIDFNDVMLARAYNGVRAYRQSKTAQIMFTFDLSERLQKDSITVNCLHPATFMDTKMTREAAVNPRNSVRSGIDAVMYLATSPELEGITGKFFDQREESWAIAQAYDINARSALRQLSEKLTGVALPD